MDERDFAELIASYLKEPSFPEIDGDSPGRLVSKPLSQETVARKTILETLIEKTGSETDSPTAQDGVSTIDGSGAVTGNGEDPQSAAAVTSSVGASTGNKLEALTKTVESIADEIGNALVVMATSDGLPVVHAGMGDPVSLAAGIPDMLASSAAKGDRLGRGQVFMLTLEFKGTTVVLAPVDNDLVLAVAVFNDTGIGPMRWSVKRHVETLKSID